MPCSQRRQSIASFSACSSSICRKDQFAAPGRSRLPRQSAEPPTRKRYCARSLLLLVWDRIGRTRPNRNALAAPRHATGGCSQTEDQCDVATNCWVCKWLRRSATSSASSSERLIWRRPLTEELSIKSQPAVRASQSPCNKVASRGQGSSRLTSPRRPKAQRSKSLILSLKYVNNLTEQNHRSIKLRLGPMLGFKQFRRAATTIADIELMHRIRKDQFKLARPHIKDKTAPEIWNAVLAA